jgi:hypothetical protein
LIAAGAIADASECAYGKAIKRRRTAAIDVRTEGAPRRLLMAGHVRAKDRGTSHESGPYTHTE